jgi:hypothetical protein
MAGACCDAKPAIVRGFVPEAMTISFKLSDLACFATAGTPDAKAKAIRTIRVRNPIKP